MELYERNLAQLGHDLLAHIPITVIQGARQTGKSTLAQMLTQSLAAMAVTLDDPQMVAAADADPTAFVNQFPQGTLVIDELQVRPELLRIIKASVDRDRRPGRFLLTGSADLLRTKGETDSLAGRAVTLELRGLSQGELAGRRDDFVAAVVAAQKWPADLHSTWRRPQYVQAMAAGGLPEVQVLPERLLPTWFDSYLQRLLERDAITLPGGYAVARIRSVARLLAANQAGELVKSRIADQAQIPQSSITTYLDALAGIYLADQLPPWTPNLTKRETARPKAFISDSALAMRLARVSRRNLEALTSTSVGGFTEAFVATELLKQQGWSSEEFRLFHYRDRDGRETDLIIELDDGRVIAIEIKASSTFKSDHFRTLRFIKDALGDRLVAGIVLAMSEQSYQYADGLWGLPISALWDPW